MKGNSVFQMQQGWHTHGDYGALSKVQAIQKPSAETGK